MKDNDIKILERMRYDAFEKQQEAVSNELFFYYSGIMDAIDEIEKILGVSDEQIQNAQ